MTSDVATSILLFPWQGSVISLGTQVGAQMKVSGSRHVPLRC